MDDTKLAPTPEPMNKVDAEPIAGTPRHSLLTDIREKAEAGFHAAAETLAAVAETVSEAASGAVDAVVDFATDVVDAIEEKLIDNADAGDFPDPNEAPDAPVDEKEEKVVDAESDVAPKDSEAPAEK